MQSTVYIDSYFLGYFTYSMACKAGETKNSTAPCRIIVRQVWHNNLTTYKKQNIAVFLCVEQDISSTGWVLASLYTQ